MAPPTGVVWDCITGCLPGTLAQEQACPDFCRATLFVLFLDFSNNIFFGLLASTSAFTNIQRLVS